jgi:probable phosphoglycerate mutase
VSRDSVCEVIVVRHGETEWNRIGRQQGHLDSPLSETGIAQAEAIAERLAGEEFTALYSSDLGRAFHTAERIAARTGREIIKDARLRERHLGIFQGLTREEAHVKHPDESERLDSGDPDYRIPGGESARARYERMVACIEEIAARHPGERIVIVSHGGALRSLFYRTVGIPLSAPRAFKLFNASINRFYFEDGAWKLATWGDISHLDGLDTIDDW